MKILFALAACFALSVFAKDRAPAQSSPYPNVPSVPSVPSPSPVAGGAFTSEDVMSSGAGGAQITVNSIVCIVSGSQPYTINASYGNDVRVSRVSSGGAISYEIYRGQRFLGACPAIHVLTR